MIDDFVNGMTVENGEIQLTARGLARVQGVPSYDHSRHSRKRFPTNLVKTIGLLNGAIWQAIRKVTVLGLLNFFFFFVFFIVV